MRAFDSEIRMNVWFKFQLVEFGDVLGLGVTIDDPEQRKRKAISLPLRPTSLSTPRVIKELRELADFIEQNSGVEA